MTRNGQLGFESYQDRHSFIWPKSKIADVCVVRGLMR
jgi:hypothetical protein